MQGKNNMTGDLSSCVIQKINGYEILKTQLKNEEKRCHEPVDIIYELVNDKIHRVLFHQQFVFSIQLLLF